MCDTRAQSDMRNEFARHVWVVDLKPYTACSYKNRLRMSAVPESPHCSSHRKVTDFFFILVINQLHAQNLFYNKFISCLYMFRAPCARRQEVKILLYSLWYHHTEASEWSKITKITKITKIKSYKYERIVVKFSASIWLIL